MKENPINRERYVGRGTGAALLAGLIVALGTGAALAAREAAGETFVPASEGSVWLLRGHCPELLKLTTVSPWVIDRMKAKYTSKNDCHTEIRPPIRSGVAPSECADEPDEAEVVRARSQLPGGISATYEVSRNDVKIATERVVDRLDPPRFIPLVGPARLHHLRWKCTVSYTETVQTNHLFPYCAKKPYVKVVYVAKDHLHLGDLESVPMR
jgi:hypothetical protein